MESELTARHSGVVKHWPTWMPFSGFKKHAVITRAIVEDHLNIPYNWVKGRMVGSTDYLMDRLLVNHRSRF